MPESDLFKEISSLFTEKVNPASKDIDLMSTADILYLINSEDAHVHEAVKKEIPNIAKAADAITEAFKRGGRLFYFGAGTSGRLGIVDAAECPPTFGSDPEMVQGLIAGGKEAVFVAQEGAEDLPENGALEFEKYNITGKDIVCGIAASGRTPYVKGALQEAANRKITSIIISTVPKEQVVQLGIKADIYINPVVGPEVITGSTRMKSGTAQKLVLNMLTTTAMVKLGKTYGNIMVDLQMTNAKLKERSKKIIMTLAGIDYDEAEKILKDSNFHVKTALVMAIVDVDAGKAHELLKEADGFVKIAIQKGLKK